MTRTALLSSMALAGLLVALAGGRAAAQPAGGKIAGAGFHPIEGVGQPPSKREPAPPGLPGSQPQGSPAPAAGLQTDVPPTEALFDAINRGDLTAAKDALNRGADLSGRNVLGMTPLDLSVDLSRNDITFLLLSLRSQFAVSSGPNGAPPPGGGKGGAGAKGTAQAAADSKRAQRQAKARGPRSGETATVTAQAPPPAPAVRYASVPAPAAPNAGFLGFGSTTSP